MVMTLSQPEHDEFDDRDDDPIRFKLTINPAVVKGAIFGALGLFILVFPSLTADVIKPVIAVGLIGFGLTEFWAYLKQQRRERTWSNRLLPMIPVAVGAVAVGVLLLVFPTETLDGIAKIVALVLLAPGLGAVARLVFHRSQGVILDVITAGLTVSLGVLLITVPEQIAKSLVGGAAIAALVIGGIMIAFGMRDGGPNADVDVRTLGDIAKTWLRTRDIGEDRRDSLSDDLYFESPHKTAKYAAWWVMMILSVAIATYAIIQDSTAVVIGAMLVAPLMTPIVGAAAAIVNGRRARMIRSLLLVAVGVLVAITLSFIIGKWSPTFTPLETNPQVTSRTSPNIIDMAIALAAGAAGAFAMINRRVASSLAGVAIAVALVPPLAVVGLMIGISDLSSAWGAFLLFSTNLVSILLSATFVFGISGWTSVKRLQEKSGSIAVTVGAILAAAMVILLPLMFTSQGILIASSQQTKATAATDSWLSAGAPLLSVDSVKVDGNTVAVAVSGPQQIPDPVPLAQTLSDEFGEPTTVKVTLTPSAVVTSTESGNQTEQSSTGINPVQTSQSPSPTASPSGTPTPSESASTTQPGNSPASATNSAAPTASSSPKSGAAPSTPTP